MAYSKGQPGCDGRMTTEKADMGGLTASGDPKVLSHRGRSSAANIAGERATTGPSEYGSTTPGAALDGYGGLSGGQKLGSLKGDGESIAIPKDGEAIQSNRPIR